MEPAIHNRWRKENPIGLASPFSYCGPLGRHSSSEADCSDSRRARIFSAFLARRVRRRAAFLPGTSSRTAMPRSQCGHFIFLYETVFIPRPAPNGELLLNRIKSPPFNIAGCQPVGPRRGLAFSLLLKTTAGPLRRTWHQRWSQRATRGCGSRRAGRTTSRSET